MSSMPAAINATADAVRHLQALIACRSVTPNDDGAQDYLAGVLTAAGFTVERLTFSAPDTSDVANLLATIGSGPPHLVFVGHSDVVPPGDEASWSHPPFSGEIADGFLYGRGAVDMKGGIAAFLAAALAFVGEGRPQRGSLSLMITSDEEGPAINGTARLVEWAKEKGHRFDAALVGEPTSQVKLGDTIKIGRRGSLSGTIIVAGVQGHVAYPHLAENPIPEMVRILDRLTRLRLDEGSGDFEPSNLEITAIETDNRAFNVIPAEVRARFNIRFNDYWSPSALMALLRREIAEVGECDIVFEPGISDWFLTRAGTLVAPLSQAIEEVTGLRPEVSTGGGTSDARFFKDLCPVVEFGLAGATMHQVDERVAIADLTKLTAIYLHFLDRVFAPDAR
jgi:succinyl-diaminopimelate desuccinylase